MRSVQGAWLMPSHTCTRHHCCKRNHVQPNWSIECNELWHLRMQEPVTHRPTLPTSNGSPAAFLGCNSSPPSWLPSFPLFGAWGDPCRKVVTALTRVVLRQDRVVMHSAYPHPPPHWPWSDVAGSEGSHEPGHCARWLARPLWSLHRDPPLCTSICLQGLHTLPKTQGKMVMVTGLLDSGCGFLARSPGMGLGRWCGREG